MITGVATCDLTAVREDRQRQRVAAVLAGAPNGVRVILDVGPLAPLPSVLDVVLRHVDRLHLEVHGEPYAVERWVEALRSGDILTAVAGWSP